MTLTDGASAGSTARRCLPKRIAVAGNPNSGKTTVFNSLTGLRQKVGNYPGVTVEKREGTLIGDSVSLIDLPGTYSLSARSPDEKVARDVLLGHVRGVPRPDGVLIVIDASNLERNLYLASQIVDLGVPAVIACNMMDVASAHGLRIDCKALARELGVTVVGTVAHHGRGIDELRQAIRDLEARPPRRRPWRLPEPVERCLTDVAAAMAASGHVPESASAGAAVLWTVDYLSGDATTRRVAERFCASISDQHASRMREAADALATTFDDVAGLIVEARYAWLSETVRRGVQSTPGRAWTELGAETVSDRIDRVVTHRVLGPAVFAGVMFVFFLSIFSWAQPLMDLIAAGQTLLSESVRSAMAPGALRSLLTDGVITGVGSVLTFFPQICILFLGLGILEDSGYMARAAFLMDRVMSRVGLHGRSFVPLLSSYACAIPGILATRTIEDRRDRFTTIMVAPLMSCSARLPVYTIIIAAVFGHRVWMKAGVMFGLYALGTLTALAMALLFKKTLFAGPRPTFIMELPPYHRPRPRPILRGVWDRSKMFLTRAGTTIFAACVVVWALSYFPRVDPAARAPAVQAKLAALDDTRTVERHNILAAEQLRGSYLGRLGHCIEPVIRPLGFDWRLGVGVLSSFLAREVFVGTMGITFSLGEADETSIALQEQLAGSTWPDGRTVLTPLVGIGLMVFYVLACQCVSTLAVTRRETGSWRWPALMFGYMTALAYAASLLVYQVGSRLGVG
ncbi:MAG: ferrous iron transport protein B [Phycisphaerae bacterium]